LDASTAGARITYKVEQLGDFTVEPQTGGCSTELVIRGDGFPPGAEVQISAHKLGSDSGVFKGPVVADDMGRVELRTFPSPPLPEQCDTSGVLRFGAFVAGNFGALPALDAVWTTDYEYAPQ
jgi:hypothetical protein